MTTKDLRLHHSNGSVDVRASVDLLGGGLRSLTVGADDLVEPYPFGEPAPYCSGAVLFPWPNRVRDGRWSHGGIAYQLPINDVELGNANHGLVCDRVFSVETRAPSAAAVATTVEPRPGYPFRVRLKVTYRLADDGLEVTDEITNLSATPAPVAVGHHPYVRVGDASPRDLTVQIAAETYLPTDRQLIPIGSQPVEGTRADLRRGERVQSLESNTCYRADGGRAGRHQYAITATDGRKVEVWSDRDFGYVQIYRCPEFPRSSGVGVALAIEPMTAPADSLNSGIGLRWLDPRDSWTVSWGIRLRKPDRL